MKIFQKIMLKRRNVQVIVGVAIVIIWIQFLLRPFIHLTMWKNVARESCPEGDGFESEACGGGL